MHVVVVGAGGLGGYFGGLLARRGANVTFIARGANLAALQTRGLTVRSVHGDFSLPVRARAEVAGLPPADVMLFCVKTYDVAQAAALVQPLVTDDTAVLTLQNGVDTPSTLQAFFGRGTVLAGVTRIGSTLVAPGVVEQQTEDRLIELGSLEAGGEPQVEKVCRLLTQAGIPVQVRADIRKSLWEKLVFISPFSGLSTLTRLTVAQLLAHEPTRALYRTLLEEAVAVAQAAGIAVAPDLASQIMQYLEAAADPGASSMAVDFAQRRPLEVEAIHGALVRHGQRLGVATPVTAAVYRALVVMDHYNRQPKP
ncbi:MAG: 2-dehydropantoate 2-reductase [Candidatus Tectimicrobiota bacterium]|nr:MAG: 2-dehydropantoate 2-reductase [Candidatus Tectomicrobia bacterium]